MKKQNYTIGERLMAYILLVGLFLQSCNNPYVGPSFNKQESITKDEQPNSAALLIETPLLATELQESIEKEELVNKSPDPWLGDDLATTAKPKNSESQLGTNSLPTAKAQEEGLATKPGITTLKPSQLIQVSPSLSSKEKTKSKPVRERLQATNPIHERGQQVKAPSTSLVVEQTPQLAKQALEKAPMLTKGRYQMTFEKTSEGPWKAIVNESFQVGISRKLALPVFFELGYNISHVADSHWVHVIAQGARSFIWVGSVGIKGGMYQEEEDDNNNKSNRNSNRNNSKAEVTTQVIPSDLSGKLKYLYRQDDTLPKLIEDEDIPEQSIQDYYVKLQVVLQENFGEGRSAAARDQVVGEKRPMEVDNLFDEMDKDHPAVSRVLLLGGAGIGKSTLMHYISYQWAHGKLWKDKYEHVFRVRLKDLLDPRCLSDYTREEKNDMLACFIHSCLDRQKTALAVKGNEQLEEIGYDLEDIKQLLKDPNKKEKVLLLVDGYDEVTSLKGKPEYQKIVELGVFKHPQLIMTSRPNAASKEIRAKFERQVESQGLDEAGINQYISLQFKQAPALAQGLKNFLVSNSQVKSICEVPINMALLCITWKDPTTRAKLSSSTGMQTDFKLGQLYHELIVWLGKRHAIKYNQAYQSPTALRELPDEAVLEEEVFKALERIAYQSFTGVGLEDQARQGGTLGIPGQLVAKLAEKESKLSLTQLHQYGLLRGEGDPNKPLEQMYYFIHLTFQEYLTAHRLCKLLGQEDKAEVAKVATWLANHRNEPKYLMTFKFLAGLVSQGKDERLVRRFWEAMSCNVEGIIELGVEGKVKLFMHLLSQSKIGGEFDKRIPHIAQITKLVDSTLQGDLVKWQQAIIEAGYYPTWLQEAASKVLAAGIWLAKRVSLIEEHKMRLQAAANLLSKIVNQGGTLVREQLFDQFMELVRLKDWQFQKLGLEKAREVVDSTIAAQKIEETAQDIVGLLGDANLQEAARGLFAKLCQISQPVLKHLIPLLADKEYLVQHSAGKTLREIVKSVPELGKEALEALKLLLVDKDRNIRSSAAEALGTIVQSAPGLGKEVWEALKILLADSNKYVRSRAADALPAIVKSAPELSKEVMEALKPLLADSNEDVRISAAYALGDMVKSVPELRKEGLEALKPLLADCDDGVRSHAAHALEAIVKLAPELKKEILEALKPLLDDKNFGVQISAAIALKEIVQSKLGLGNEVLEALKLLLARQAKYIRSSDINIRWSAIDDLKDILQSMPGEKALDALKPLLTDKNNDVRSSAAEALITIAQSAPGLGKEGLKTLKPLLADEDKNIRVSAAYPLLAIVQSAPGLGKEVCEALKPLLADSNEDVRSTAADALGKIVKLAPELRKEVLETLKPLLADEDKDVRWIAANALREIIQSEPGLGKEVWEALKPLLADENEYVRIHAAYALVAIVQPVPGLGKEVLEALKPLLADEDNDVRISAAAALVAIVQSLPGLGKEVLEALKPLLVDKDDNVRKCAANALKEIVKLVPELGKEVLGTLKPLLDDKDKDVRWMATDALVAIVQSAPGLGKEVLEALKPLLADNNKDVRAMAADALAAIAQPVPGLRKEVLEALKPLLADKDKDVRAMAANALAAIAQPVPGLRKEVLEALKPLLADNNKDVRIIAADALAAIVQSAPGLGKEVLEALESLPADEYADVRIHAADALATILQSVPGLRKKVREAFEPLLYDSNKWVRGRVAHALEKIVKSVPRIGKQVLKAFKSLLADNNKDVRKSAAYALLEIIKSVPQVEKEAFQVFKPLLADKDKDVRWMAADALIAIIQSVPGLRKEILEASKPLLADSDWLVQISAADALRATIQLVPLSEPVVSLLANANSFVRQVVKEGLIAKFKSAEKIEYQELDSLIKLVAAHQGAQEELDKALYVAANKTLQQLAGTLDPNGIQWLNAHFTELPKLPVVQTFLKAVIAKTLGDRMLDLQAAELLIKCIVARGLTATINPQAHQIILEDNTYILQPAAQANLTYVVNEVIRLSTDPIAQQYKDHKPLFKNSREALPLATADIEQVVSILDKTPLNSNSWHVSVLDLSDHHQSKPSKTFVLLEQRNYAGQHVIHQLELYQEKGKVSSHALNPLAVDQMKQKIFGELYLMKKPRCYGYSFALSQKLGEELIKAASQMKGEKDSYSVLHKLASDYQAMQVNQKRKASDISSDLLSLSWEDYTNHPAVKKHKKEELHEEAMGSGGGNVHVNMENVENLIAENIEDLQVKNIGNVNTRNIEELQAKNVKNVNVKNLFN